MKSNKGYCHICMKNKAKCKCPNDDIMEARKRDHVANAVLSLAFAANAVQSPKDFVRTGHIEGPGIQLMARMMKRRAEANRNLDNSRVSDSARNKKLKESAKIKNDKKRDMMIALIRKLIQDKKQRKNYLLNYGYIGEESKSPAWKRNEGKDLKKGGLNRKGIASYRKEHPGSKLSMAVTTKPSKLKKGSKSWKRRKSFCSRMSGMQGPMRDEKGRPTRKALSLRKWNC